MMAPRMRALVLLSLLSAEPKALTSFDKARFAGRWYEQARLPSFFQKGCTDTTATYTLNADGELDVENRCLKDGKASGIKGTAWVADEKQPGKLTLQLVWPFRSQLWALERADDWSWVLMGTPDRDKAWVFTKEAVVPASLTDALLERLKAHGYDPTQFERVSHSADAGHR